MRTRWISPQFVSTNRLDTAPEYGELREMGQRVIAALGIGTSATHMEWFFGPKGLRFSEIGCRPPGVGAWDLYSAGNDMDLYRDWADAIVHGGISAVPSRRYASGIVALRPSQDGSISGYSGVDELQQQYGEWVIDAHLPPPGTPTQGVEAGYMANAYVRMRHPDYDTLRGMLDDGGPHACTSTPREDRPARTAAQADARGGPVAGPLGPGRAGGHDHGRMAGARAGRRRAGRACSAGPRGQPGACTGGGWTCRTATRSTAPGSASWPACSPSCRSCTCCGSTTRCGRCTRCSGGPPRPRLPATRSGEAVEAVRELDAAHLRRVNERARRVLRPAAGRTTGR